MSEVALKAEVAQKAVQLRKALEGAVTKLSASELELWTLRLREVSLWQSAEPASPNARAEKIWEQVLLVLERRDSAITAALARIRTIDDAYDAVGRRSVNSDATVAAARKRFDEAEAEVARRTVEDPSIVAIDREEERLLRIKALNSNWQEDLDKLIAEREDAYRNDPVFSYLEGRGFGTEDYHARWPISALDAKLAAWSQYAAERANLEAVRAYPGEYAKTMERLEASLARITPARQTAVRRIKDSLDPEREILARALNSAAAVVDQFEDTRAAKTAAFKRIDESLAGNDAETKMVTEAVVALLARERAAAALRASEKVAKATAADVDALVKSRIAIAKETDILRRKAVELLHHLADIQKLLDEAASRNVGPERFEFAVVSAGAAMA
ncbi:hypothetical protein D3C71_402230 [compost metagenome]